MADIIVASLLVDGTAVPRKVARLHLICDILHNSAASVPSAWKFRQEFQARLGIVFDHLANIYHSFPGRITAETFKKQITAVVDIWEDWIVFPPDFTSELRVRLEGAIKETETRAEVLSDSVTKSSEAPYASRFKSSTFQLASETVGQPLPDQGELPTADLDGEPMDDDLDGEPVDDIDGDPLDGEVIDGEDIDGEAIDGQAMDADPDDLDGAPMDQSDGER